MREKIYIGDGVYVLWQKYGPVILTTENGISIINEIIFEPEVLSAFLKFIERKNKEEVNVAPNL